MFIRVRMHWQRLLTAAKYCGRRRRFRIWVPPRKGWHFGRNYAHIMSLNTMTWNWLEINIFNINPANHSRLEPANYSRLEIKIRFPNTTIMLFSTEILSFSEENMSENVYMYSKWFAILQITNGIYVFTKLCLENNYYVWNISEIIFVNIPSGTTITND